MVAQYAQQDLATSRTLGKYHLITPIGRGGMATVHLAVVNGPAGFNKLVVVKQMHAQFAEDPEILAMFLAEARLTARLSHPNVAHTIDFWREGDHHCMAMEFLDGQPLNRILQRLHRRGGLPLPLFLLLISDLLGGLHYAHELADYDGTPLGIVHRDVTPQNIFVTYDGIVKVVDFGIAKTQDSEVHTGLGIIKGKVAYMAPEQARAEPVDRRADVFSVGVMLWEAVTGTRPWKGIPDISVVRRLLARQFPSAHAVQPGLPPALEAIVRKALAHDPADRYATAAEMRADIDAYLASAGLHPSPRDLGKLVSTEFEAERAAMGTLIEAHLRHDEGGAPASARPGPGADRPTMPSAKRSDPSVTASDAAEEKHPFVASAVFAGTPSQRIERAPRLRRPLIGATAAVCGALLVAVLVLAPRTTHPRAGAAAPAPAAPANVDLRLVASPPEARFFLDGAPLAGNPFRGTLPRDAGAHWILIEAPGFVTRTERVILDRDAVVDVALAADPLQLPAAAASSQVVPRTYSPGFHGKQRSLDSRNPYDGR